MSLNAVLPAGGALRLGSGGSLPVEPSLDMTAEHHYNVRLEWRGSNGIGTVSYAAYSRAHELHGDGKQPILGSADPHFRGDATRWNPEELLIASLSACHQLWYLHLCAEAKIIVTAYEDFADGTLALNADGSGEFISATLRPQVTIALGSDPEQAISLHGDAYRKCFIARSVKFPVTHEPKITLGPRDECTT